MVLNLVIISEKKVNNAVIDAIKKHRTFAPATING